MQIPRSPVLNSALRIALFLATFAMLQLLWTWGRGGWLEHLWTEDLTVRGAIAALSVISPGIHATASGSRIVAAGGGLNILQGCAGIEVVFMLIAAFAAFAAFRAPLRVRLLGIGAGIVFIFVLNELRILALFYAFRSNRQVFDFLHTTGAPLVLVALTGLYFQAWVWRAKRLEEAISRGEITGDESRVV
jgi:exosortase/archaeosortase family protein